MYHYGTNIENLQSACMAAIRRWLTRIHRWAIHIWLIYQYFYHQMGYEDSIFFFDLFQRWQWRTCIHCAESWTISEMMAMLMLMLLAVPSRNSYVALAGWVSWQRNCELNNFEKGEGCCWMILGTSLNLKWGKKLKAANAQKRYVHKRVKRLAWYWRGHVRDWISSGPQRMILVMWFIWDPFSNL